MKILPVYLRYFQILSLREMLSLSEGEPSSRGFIRLRRGEIQHRDAVGRYLEYRGIYLRFRYLEYSNYSEWIEGLQ